jgi:hypothetical protein
LHLVDRKKEQTALKKDVIDIDSSVIVKKKPKRLNLAMKVI